jgi:hypothetical protein
MAWTDHSVPSGGALVTEVLGALLGPGEVNLHFAVDDAGNLWEWNASQNWVSHGVPSADIRVRAQVGAAWARGYMESPVFSSVFVIGTDGHLWERTPDPHWQWVDHGKPAVDRITTTVSPLVVFVGEEGNSSYPEVPFVDADGHVWSRVSRSQWADRSSPPGRAVVEFVGADGISHLDTDFGMSVAAAIADDGKVWGWSSDNGWVSLGPPGTDDRAIAGIAAARIGRLATGPVVAGGHPANGSLQAIVLGGPGRRLWSVVWHPDTAAAQQWQDIGTPPGTTVRGTVGMIDRAPGRNGMRLVVIGSDGGLWLAVVPEQGAAAWTSLGLPGPAVVAGVLVRGEQNPWNATATVAAADGHLWSSTIPD